MRKKLLVLLGVVAAAAFACFMLLFYRGNDELTFFERQNVNQYFAAVPFEQDGGGNNILMPVAVAAGINGSPTNTYLGVRTQVDYMTGSIEVKVAVSEKGEVVLADSFDSIGAEPVALRRAIGLLGENSRLVVNLSEYKGLSAVNSALLNGGVLTKTVVTGVEENAVKYVKAYFPNVKVLCNYGKDNVRSLESIAADGADGIFCSAEVFDNALLSRAKKLGLLVWVNCETDIYATVKAMKFEADGIVTSRPDFTMWIGREWHKEGFEAYFEQPEQEN